MATLTGTGLDIITSRGRLIFDGNELSVESTIDDPPKLRLASVGNALGAVTFNILTSPVGGGQSYQKELIHLRGSRSVDEPSGLGGQFEIWMHERWTDDDSSLKLVGVISAAYTSDGKPVIRFQGNTVSEDLTKFTDSPKIFPQILESSFNNLSGALTNLAFEDNMWLSAINPAGDVDLSLKLVVPNDVSLLHIEMRRTSNNNGNAPYVYIVIDGVNFIAIQPISINPILIQLPIIPGIRQLNIHVAAQDGTVEFGTVYVR